MILPKSYLNYLGSLISCGFNYTTLRTSMQKKFTCKFKKTAKVMNSCSNCLNTDW